MGKGKGKDSRQGWSLYCKMLQRWSTTEKGRLWAHDTPWETSQQQSIVTCRSSPGIQTQDTGKVTSSLWSPYLHSKTHNNKTLLYLAFTIKILSSLGSLLSQILGLCFSWQPCWIPFLLKKQTNIGSTLTKSSTKFQLSPGKMILLSLPRRDFSYCSPPTSTIYIFRIIFSKWTLSSPPWCLPKSVF